MKRPYGNLNMPPTIRISEVEWLLLAGEDLGAIAGRLGVGEGGIVKALNVAGRADLLARIRKAV